MKVDGDPRWICEALFRSTLRNKGILKGFPLCVGSAAGRWTSTVEPFGDCL